MIYQKQKIRTLIKQHRTVLLRAKDETKQMYCSKTHFKINEMKVPDILSIQNNELFNTRVKGKCWETDVFKRLVIVVILRFWNNSFFELKAIPRT